MSYPPEVEQAARFLCTASGPGEHKVVFSGKALEGDPPCAHCQWVAHTFYDAFRAAAEQDWQGDDPSL